MVNEKANKKIELENIYHNQYQDVLNQINQENALAEDVRQYNESLAEDIRQYNEGLAYQKERDKVADEQWKAELEYQKERDKVADSQWQKEYDLTASKYSSSSSSSSGGSGGSINKTSSSSSHGGGGKKITETTTSKTKISNVQSSPSNNTTMKSISNLGYGPISAAQLNALVASGEVIEYKENGVTKFKKAPKTNAKTAREKVTYNKYRNLFS